MYTPLNALENAGFGNPEAERAFAHFCTRNSRCKKLVAAIKSQRQELDDTKEGIGEQLALSASLNQKEKELAYISDRIADASQAFETLGLAGATPIARKARENFRGGDFHTAADKLSDQAIDAAIALEENVKARQVQARQLHVLKANLALADAFNFMGTP